MAALYRAGAVQRLAERVLALGLRFDDDGVVDVFLFGQGVHRPEPGLRLEGHQQYIADLTRQYPLEYDTRYGAAMAAVRQAYFGDSRERVEPQPAQVPVYVMFLTDGPPPGRGRRLRVPKQSTPAPPRQYPLEYDTRYGAAMAAVRQAYFGDSRERVEPQPAQVPVYVMFLTDGAPSDKAVATRQIRAASYEPVFWQFMGIGPERQFSYLQRLDDLDGRYTDNADFFAVKI